MTRMNGCTLPFQKPIDLSLRHLCQINQLRELGATTKWCYRYRRFWK
jgi:hypothetical protein